MSMVELSAAVIKARHDLGITQEDVERRGGPSVATLGTIERRRNVGLRPKTLRTLDIALGWPLGTAGALLQGKAEPPSSPPTSSTSNTLAELVAASVAAGRMRVLAGWFGGAPR